MRDTRKPGEMDNEGTREALKTGKSPAARLYLSPLEWEAVRVRYIMGETAANISKALGIKPDTIKRRAFREKWRKPDHSPNGVRVDSGVPEIPQTAAPLAPDSGITSQLVTISSETQTPDEFQAAVSKHAKALMALGLPTLAPPKSISEAKILNDLIRKADGYDSKEGTSVSIGIINPIRSLQRIVSNTRLNGPDLIDLTPETGSQ